MSTPEGELALRRRRRRKRPRRLASVELPTEADASANLYEDPSEGSSMMLSLLSTAWMERPLPPMAVLAALPPTNRGGAVAGGPECPPLLVDFLKSIGVVGNGDDRVGGAQREDMLGTSAADGEGGNMANGTAPAATAAAREEEEGAGRDDGETANGVQKPAAAAAEETEEGPGEAADAAAASATEVGVEPIDDPNSSTLTSGQHARYLQLWASSSSSREFRSLDQAVRKEWVAYVAAVAEFRRRNVGRFLLGFARREGDSGGGGGGASASNFVEAAAALRQSSVGGNNNSAKVYGAKCVQEISLQGVAAATEQMSSHSSKRRRKQNGGSTAGARAFDIKSYSARIVHSTPSNGVGRLRRDWAADQSSLSSTSLRPATSPRRNNPARASASSIQPIAQDDMAARLASEHGVDAVMTADTFVELLRRPGEADSRWMVPLSRANGDDCSLVLLEEPIPRRATTREYLTKAYEESVYESAGRLVSAEVNNGQEMNSLSQSVYTVISLPGSSPQDAPCKVLVRSINTLLSDDGNHQRPIYLDVHLEYFNERGLVEQIPRHRRATWLAHKLLQPDCQLMSVRVDPNTSRMISVSEKSVAHALAGSDKSSMVAHAYRASADCGNLLHLTEFDASAQFEAMERVVRASTTCKFSGNLGGLLCLPGRGLSSATTNKAVTVSVHQEVEGDAGAAADSNTTADQDLIKIGTEIEEADAVFTGQAALMSCFVPWEWRDDPEITRIPFTFPVHAERS